MQRLGWNTHRLEERKVQKRGRKRGWGEGGLEQGKERKVAAKGLAPVGVSPTTGWVHGDSAIH